MIHCAACVREHSPRFDSTRARPWRGGVID
jgi:hypothetical protein